jgi:hypothetical protein
MPLLIDKLMNKKISVVFLIVLAMFSCNKDTTTTNLPAASGPTINVTINQNQPGIVIPQKFQGLSFETKILSQNPEFLNVNNAVLIQLIKNLGPGILRIGGGTSDEVEWTGHARTALSGEDSLTTTDIDRMSAFAKIIGWPVLFGLNLADNNINKAVNESLYVHNSLNGNLYAFQSGNEPDVFNLGARPSTYNYNSYKEEWEDYLYAVRNLLPLDDFAGPDVAYNTDWYTSFTESEHSKVKLLDGHRYLTGPASSTSITYHTILEYSVGLSIYLQPLKNEAAKYGVPYRITECNSIYGGGKPGVSDVFAATLYSLDFMWAVAANKSEGVNFHGGNGLCYSPVLMQANNVYAAGPVYYAMLAFKYGSTGGAMLPTTTTNSSYCTAYSVVNPDNTYTVTLINKDYKTDYAFNLQLSKTASSVQIARLTAPSITSTTGITFADVSVNAGGAFNPGSKEEYTVNATKFVINVPAGSAAVVTVK